MVSKFSADQRFSPNPSASLRLRAIMQRPDHPSNADLAAYAAGRLAALRAALVERHLVTCEACVEIVAQQPADDFMDRLRHATQWQRALAADRDEDSNDSSAQDASENASRPWLLTWPVANPQVLRVLRSPAVFLPALTAVVCLLLLYFL